jgi:hypothetical protein
MTPILAPFIAIVFIAVAAGVRNQSANDSIGRARKSAKDSRAYCLEMSNFFLFCPRFAIGTISLPRHPNPLLHIDYGIPTALAAQTAHAGRLDFVA